MAPSFRNSDVILHCNSQTIDFFYLIRMSNYDTGLLLHLTLCKIKIFVGEYNEFLAIRNKLIKVIEYHIVEYINEFSFSYSYNTDNIFGKRSPLSPNLLYPKATGFVLIFQCYCFLSFLDTFCCIAKHPIVPSL